MNHPNRCKGPVLCPDPMLYDTNSFFLEAGFVYLKPYLSGVLFAHTNFNNTPFQPPLSGIVLREDLNANWGFLASAGYYFNHDHWVLSFDFSAYKTNVSSCKDSFCDNDFFVPDCVWCHDSIPEPFKHYNPAYTDEIPYYSSSLVHYTLKDSLSRGSFFTQNFSFSPAFGIKASWLAFRQKACFKDLHAYGNCCSIFKDQLEPYWADFVHKAKSKFFGVGPHIALNTYFTVFECTKGSINTAKVFSDFDTALLVGRTSSVDELFVNKDATTRIHNDYNLMSPCLEWTIGFLLEKITANQEKAFSCKIGWNNLLYFNQNTTNCYTGICGLKTNEHNTFATTGLLASLTASF